MMSLFAFILVLGILVDDAIVAGENIFEHRQREKPYAQAAIDGALEVSVPVKWYWDHPMAVEAGSVLHAGLRIYRASAII